MKKILILGHKGFLGSHLYHFLHTKSYEILTLPNDHRFKQEDSYTDFFKNLIDNLEPDYVVNCIGAFGNLPKTLLDYINFEIPVMLMDALLLSQKKTKLLLISSSAIYGDLAFNHLMMTEMHPRMPQNHYGISKDRLLNIVDNYYSQDIDVVQAIPFNIIGKGLSNKLFPSIIHHSLIQYIRTNKMDDRVAKIYHPTQSRDYVDVFDVVSAIELLLTAGRSGESYNICSGIATSNIDLVSLFIEAMNINFIPEQLNTKSNIAVKIQRGSSKKINNLGWVKKINLMQSINNIVK
jgi:GDP-4-dehydro-6-deoxy-D-mannose reductase